MSDAPKEKDDNIDEVVPNFDVTQEFVDTFRNDGRVVSLIRQHFTKLPGKYASNVFTSIFTSRPIIFTDYVNSNHYCFKVMKRKIDNKYQLLPNEHKRLKKDLVLLLNEISKGFKDADEVERKDIVKIEGTNCVMVNKTHTKDELFRWFCDEDGEVQFKYDFSNSDLDLTTPITNNNLQRVRIQITSLPIVFGLVIQQKYTCPDKTNTVAEEFCSSPQVIAKRAYEVEAVRDKITCPGYKHSVDAQGRNRRKKCGNTLYPVQKLSRYVDCYFYDINFEDNEGMIQTSSSFSFNKMMPGFYEAIIYSYTSNLRPTNYQIVDVKPIEDVCLEIPYKEEGKNYILTLQEAIDNFIHKQTGQRIYGLVPIKLALILQKLACEMDYPLKFGIDFSGDKSCFPKGTLIQTPVGLQPIEEVNKVLSYDFKNKKIVESDCVNINTGQQEIYKIYTEKGIVECSGNHLWYVLENGELITKKTKDLNITDILIDIEDEINMKTCLNCKKVKKIHAKGLCRTCYDKIHIRKKVICKRCGKEKYHCAKGLCYSCYQTPIIKCKECGEKKPNFARGLCSKCYQKKIPKKLITCKICNKIKNEFVKGLCGNCYRKERDNKNE